MEKKMQTYVGTKTLRAAPMNKGAYNLLRGWDMPMGEDPKEKGYLVEYQDGGKANHPNFKGYISWSPKDVFEQSYRVANTFLDRLVIEQHDLKDKLDKLVTFLSGDGFQGISETQQEFLVEQRIHMSEYLSILDQRIEDLSK